MDFLLKKKFFPNIKTWNSLNMAALAWNWNFSQQEIEFWLIDGSVVVEIEFSHYLIAIAWTWQGWHWIVWRRRYFQTGWLRTVLPIFCKSPAGYTSCRIFNIVRVVSRRVCVSRFYQSHLALSDNSKLSPGTGLAYWLDLTELWLTLRNDNCRTQFCSSGSSATISEVSVRLENSTTHVCFQRFPSIQILMGVF